MRTWMLVLIGVAVWYFVFRKSGASTAANQPAYDATALYYNSEVGNGVLI